MKPHPPLARERVLQLIQRMRSSRVVVVGDIMLDRYLIGDTERLSPEAPVPVVTVSERHAELGGAANVAHKRQGAGSRGNPYPCKGTGFPLQGFHLH